MKDKKGLLVESKPTNYLYSHSRSCKGCDYCKTSSPKDYLTDREKLMEKIREILVGKSPAGYRLFFMKHGLSMSEADEMINGTVEQLLTLLTSEVEKAKKQYIEMGELIGVGKVLDNLWDNSYYSMGKLGADRIEQEMTYYFGKDWNVDMYKIIAKNGMRAQSVKPLKDYTKEQRKALSGIGGKDEK